MDEGNWIIFQNEAILGSEVGMMPTYVLLQLFLLETLRKAHVTLMDDTAMATP